MCDNYYKEENDACIAQTYTCCPKTSGTITIDHSNCLIYQQTGQDGNCPRKCSSSATPVYVNKGDLLNLDLEWICGIAHAYTYTLANGESRPANCYSEYVSFQRPGGGNCNKASSSNDGSSNDTTFNCGKVKAPYCMVIDQFDGNNYWASEVKIGQKVLVKLEVENISNVEINSQNCPYTIKSLDDDGSYWLITVNGECENSGMSITFP